jgi:exopolysaccharide biosynthesis protein
MKIKFPIPKIKKPILPKIRISKRILPIIYIIAFIALTTLSFVIYRKSENLKKQIQKSQIQNQELTGKYEESQKSITDLQNEDQRLKNKTLEDEIKNIQNIYKKAVSTYENLLDLKDKTKDTSDLDEAMALSFSLLSQRKYQEADDVLTQLDKDIKSETDKIASTFKIPESAPVSSSPPGSGYARQTVQTDTGNFLVDIISADLGSTKVIVDTASDSDCSNDCPTLSLSEYVSRTGAYAGINGTYFCPATYPTCSGKTNSYDLLVMNYKKTYFNSGNNVYSGNPAVIFGDNYVRFITAASQWGRDTSPNGVLSNYPLLISNSNISFGGDDDPKKGSKGARSFVANKGNTIYIGVVHNSTVAESARVMKAMGMENALNLDDGGSTALWSGGYKVGPGRNLPNVILFFKK